MLLWKTERRSSKNEYRIGNKILVETKEVSKIDKEIYFTLDKNLIKENSKVKINIKDDKIIIS